MVRFSEDFLWYGKEFEFFQTFGPRYLKLFVPNLWNFQIQFIFLSCWTIRHSQLESVLYEARIIMIESFVNFNTQTTIVGNIHVALS